MLFKNRYDMTVFKWWFRCHYCSFVGFHIKRSIKLTLARIIADCTSLNNASSFRMECTDFLFQYSTRNSVSFGVLFTSFSAMLDHYKFYQARILHVIIVVGHVNHGKICRNKNHFINQFLIYKLKYH